MVFLLFFALFLCACRCYSALMFNRVAITTRTTTITA